MDLENLCAMNPLGLGSPKPCQGPGVRDRHPSAQIHAASHGLIELLAEFEAVHGWTGWPWPAHRLQRRCGFSVNAALQSLGH